MTIIIAHIGLRIISDAVRRRYLSPSGQAADRNEHKHTIHALTTICLICIWPSADIRTFTILQYILLKSLCIQIIATVLISFCYFISFSPNQKKKNRNMDGLRAVDLLQLLQEKVVVLSGGRDLRGGPVLSFPSTPRRDRVKPEDIRRILTYLFGIPR